MRDVVLSESKVDRSRGVRRKGAGCRSAGSCFSNAAVCCKRAADPQKAAGGEPAMSQQVQGLDKRKLAYPGNLVAPASIISRQSCWT